MTFDSLSSELLVLAGWPDALQLQVYDRDGTLLRSWPLDGLQLNRGEERVLWLPGLQTIVLASRSDRSWPGKIWLIDARTGAVEALAFHPTAGAGADPRDNLLLIPEGRTLSVYSVSQRRTLLQRHLPRRIEQDLQVGHSGTVSVIAQNQGDVNARRYLLISLVPPEYQITQRTRFDNDSMALGAYLNVFDEGRDGRALVTHMDRGGHFSLAVEHSSQPSRDLVSWGEAYVQLYRPRSPYFYVQVLDYDREGYAIFDMDSAEQTAWVRTTEDWRLHAQLWDGTILSSVRIWGESVTRIEQCSAARLSPLRTVQVDGWLDSDLFALDRASHVVYFVLRRSGETTHELMRLDLDSFELLP